MPKQPDIMLAEQEHTTLFIQPAVRQQAHLAPTRPLLEAISNLLWSLANCQVLLHVTAVPLLLLEHHAKHVVLSQSVLWRPACLLERIGPDQKVSTCTSSTDALNTALDLMG